MLPPFAASTPVMFAPYSVTFTTPGAQTIPVPFGAKTVTVECYGAGGSGNARQTMFCGGGGGGYSKKNTYSLAGLTGIYISVPGVPAAHTDGADAFAKENSSGGTTICLAKGGQAQPDVNNLGGQASAGTGDVKYSGGTGYQDLSHALSAGGGGAGPTGAGGNASSATAGIADGGLSGAGGVDTATGNNYGGGAGGWDPTAFGAQGAIRLSWA